MVVCPQSTVGTMCTGEMTMRAFLQDNPSVLKSRQMTFNPVNLVCQASLFNL